MFTIVMLANHPGPYFPWPYQSRANVVRADFARSHLLESYNLRANDMRPHLARAHFPEPY
jgi:hypothetical protein